MLRPGCFSEAALLLRCGQVGAGSSAPAAPVGKPLDEPLGLALPGRGCSAHSAGEAGVDGGGSRDATLLPQRC
jgi:hypothetical protein